MKIIVGVPINSKTAYIIDEFIKNQKEIQESTKSGEVKTIFATEEIDFMWTLNDKIKKAKMNGDAIFFSIEKPENAKDRIWTIVAARNSIREYFLSHESDYLVFIDGDMVYNPKIIDKMVEKVDEGYDIVVHLYEARQGVGLLHGAFGGILIKRWIMEKIKFRCFETEDGLVGNEGWCFWYDLKRYKIKAKIFRGIIAETLHYNSKNEFTITPERSLKTRERIREWGKNLLSLLSIFPEEKALRLALLLRIIARDPAARGELGKKLI
ncbi:MAG: hypothetical protein H5T44_05360 [Thermoplasmatales archaeon]|nr:hypothetical protein [Thermoplasmatales archaeon]